MIEIRNWSETFETADTRKRERLGWVQWPTGTDSAEMVALSSGNWNVSGMRLADCRQVDGMSVAERQALGLAALGVYAAMVTYMGTQRREVRGRFCRADGSAMDTALVASLLRLPLQLLENALVVLSSPVVAMVSLPDSCRSSAGHLPLFSQSSADKEKEKEKEKEERSLSRAQAREAEPVADESSTSDLRPLTSGFHTVSSDRQRQIEAVVAAYPKAQGRFEAMHVLADLAEQGHDLDEIRRQTEAIAAVIATRSDADRLRVPSAHTFFLNRRFLDDPQTWRSAKTVEPARRTIADLEAADEWDASQLSLRTPATAEG